VRGGLLVADTEKDSAKGNDNKCRTMVVFPAPDGAETMISFLFDIPYCEL